MDKAGLLSSDHGPLPRVASARNARPTLLQYDDDNLIRVTVGSLNHPERIHPAGHYGVESRLADIGSGLPEEETQQRSEV